ncbi:PA1571 family protein [Alcanivorax sp. 1008]|uniref:PA1571 family protein n=1 Tax=Alcanivorax sp. 1008 TaxID=2816853 RepID=UPI001E19C14F|nr:PA1571 family protein [Alcanivorax sp. 1008]MCC1497140.1 hypothetical protein [Alcanivorax sp. 1008]
MQTHPQNTSDQTRDFHGAALIDESGREVPITEDMIRRACETLEHGWHYPINRIRQAG